MTVVPLDSAAARALGPVPDAPLTRPAARSQSSDFGADFGRALDAAEATLARADGTERAFASERGGLQEMVLARAQADVMLSIATAASSRAAQALSSVLAMQI